MNMKKQILSLALLAASVMLKAQNPYPILSVDSIQFVNLQKLSNPTANTLPDYVDPVKQNVTYGDTVRFDGVVAFNPKAYGLSKSRKAIYIQRKGGGPWSGVQVMCEPNNSGAANLTDLITQSKFYDNAIVGYNCRFTGVVRDFQGETQINLIANNANWDNFIEQLSLTPDTLKYTEISASQLMAGNPNTGWVQQKATAEQYEGGLVTIKDVSVYSITISGNRTFWSVIDDFGNVVDVRDFSAYYRRDDNEDTIPAIANTFQAPPIGTRLEYIRGAVTEYQVSGVSRYGVSPLYPTDIKVCTSCAPTVKYINRNPVLSTLTDTLNLTFEITVGDTTLNTQVFYYKKPGSLVMDSMVMTAVPSFPNYYAAKVDPVGAEGVFTWWVRAEDKKGRQTFFPDPLTLGRSFYVTTNGVNSIAQLQYSNSPSGSTIWDGDSLLNISIGGILTGKNFISGTTNLMTLQSGTGANSAIFIQKGTADGSDSWNIGDSIHITRATVRENFNVTTLFNVIATVGSTGNALPAFAMLPIDSFALAKTAYARPYEAVLMRFDSVKVFSANADAPSDFGEFSFHKTVSGPTVGLRVDDMNGSLYGLNKKLKVGMDMAFIQGPMYYSFGNFKLIPRGLTDLDLSQLDSVAPVITLLGNNPDTVIKSTVAYVDPGATASDDKDGDISANIMVTGVVNAGVVGTYILNYKVSDAWGNMDSAMRTVIVIDSANVGVNENELTFAQLSVYPNPASSHITVSGNFIKTQPVTIKVLDILGKEIANKTVYGTQFEETISTANLNGGVYFCNISNANGNKTLKFIVSGK
jgi:hypothetical protein